VWGKIGEEGRLTDDQITLIQNTADTEMRALRSGAETAHTCDFQGIRAGFVDTYDAHLAGQWIDVTDVPEGDYIFRVTINPNRIQQVTVVDQDGNQRTIPFETNFDNNVAEIQIHRPANNAFNPDAFKNVPDDN
jgi:hypothetical protein